MSEGELTVDNRGCYFKGDSRLKTGIFMGTSKGFGFVRIEGLSDDIFIPESMTKGAFDKDQVQEGEIINILSRNTKEVVGTYQKNKSFGFVIPDNQKFGDDIFIEEKNSQGAVSGHKVIVELTSFGSSKKNPEGKVIEIIGHINDPGVDIMSIILANGIPTEFPPEVMNQIKGIGNDPSPSDFSGRKDLRDVYMVTIDGEDAKDLDDAVSLSMEGDIYKLGVHIADVSHYVTENSYLDKEAINRGTSVYLVDRVIPMLPHKLSNGICSLNAGTDRLALSCIMDIDKKGNVIGHEIAETVINVNHRMTYTLVKNILEEKSVQAMPKDEAETAKYSESVPMFVLMEELAQILREKRKKRGSIDFDLPESKIKLNEEGFPESIQPYERNVATKIIEDFMLIANETVAEDFFWQEPPFVYRTHETPDPEKIQKLGIFINNFGYTIHFNQDEIHPMEISKLLAKVESKPEEALISRLTLRSMKQARYTDTCEGHFDFALQNTTVILHHLSGVILIYRFIG
ncbi:ribonuclease [Holotrichia oblita]|nr:ribonuclease [Holotrichia oblita]